MKYNTTIEYATHFLNPTQIIEEGIKKFNVSSENYPMPTKNKIGDTFDDYYAEIWSKGMDWQETFWLLEYHCPKTPIAIPVLIFEDNKSLDIFNSDDLNSLFRGLLVSRKQLKTNYKYPIYFMDGIIFYLKQISNCNKEFEYYKFVHHSQPKIKFWIKNDLIKNIEDSLK